MTRDLAIAPLDYRAIFELAPFPIYAYDLEGNVLLWNPEAERNFGWSADELIGRPLPIVPPDRAGEAHQLRENLLAGAGVGPVETERVAKDGTLFDVTLWARLLRDAAGGAVAVLVITNDISERRVLERERAAHSEKLLRSEARFRMVIEQFPALFWTVDREYRLTTSEGRGLATFALKPGELVGLPLPEVVGGVDHPAVIGAERAFQGIPSVFGGVMWRGQLYDIRVEPIIDGTGRITGAAGVALDITEMHEARQEAKSNRGELQRLSSRVLEVQEEQRTRISREVHDDLGQRLTSLKFDVAHLKKLFRSKEAGEQLNRMDANLEALLQSVRRIARELRPPILDHFGVAAAIENELRDFEQRTGIRCTLHCHPPDLNITGEHATAIYRVLQEALTNVARHAQASELAVRLALAGDCLRCEIEDDGVGFPIRIDGSRGLGLTGIRERAASLGGTLRLARSTSGGALVSVELPLDGDLSEGLQS